MGVMREHVVRDDASMTSSTRPALTRVDTLVDSYRRLADVFHVVLSEQQLEAVLERIADTLGDLIPFDAFTIYQADENRRVLIPLMSRDKWAEEIMGDQPIYGEGITGWAVENREPQLVNDAHLDPRVKVVPGTPPDEPEALMSVPLVARGTIKGALNVYRLGDDAAFTEEEFDLAQRFGDAAALALDNMRIRTALEQQANSDSLTGLVNYHSFQERLRAHVARRRETNGTLALLMLDVDDFKRINDVYGHATGDDVLVAIAELLRRVARMGDEVCRVGGEEFAVIMPSTNASAGLLLARRIADGLSSCELGHVGEITLSIGVAEGPSHAASARELIACAEGAMMSAKTGGKNRIVVYEGETLARPDARGQSRRREDVRSIAHLKLLQSLAGKLSRLNDVTAIGEAIVGELLTLFDCNSCRVYVRSGELLVPAAWHGELAYADESAEALTTEMGEGITGTAAFQGQSLLISDAECCEFAVHVPGSPHVEESVVAVPLRCGSQVQGVIVLSKLGLEQFDEDDVRLLEVLAPHAAAVIQNAVLYETVRDEAESLERTFVSTVEALANALEANDADTSSHARAITDLALSLGRRLELDEQ
jgi:diguanylate cyclase (GGDEF)-like protein